MHADHTRILDLATAALAAEARVTPGCYRSLEVHGDRCCELWAELRRQVAGRTEPAPKLRTRAEIEREVAREVRDRLRRNLPDLIAQALVD